MRFVRWLSAAIGFLTTVASLLAALALYLAASGRNLDVARYLLDRAGVLLEGQRLEQLDLDARANTASGELEAAAEVRMRSLRDDRRYLCLLLNHGLRLERLHELKEDGTRQAIRHLRFGPLLVLRPDRPLAADESLRLALAYAGRPAATGLSAPRGGIGRDEILLPVEQLWYPTDLQSFFQADVRLTAPADLTLVHNGVELERRTLGKAVRVHWTTPRPVQALSFVAGRFTAASRSEGDRSFRVYVGSGIDLDPDRVLSGATDAAAFLENLYGPSGFSQVSIYVSRSLDRAFNDGTGTIGIAPLYFTRGDYGAIVVAHEIAHNWWGATVAEKWLRPGTGGEWIVEGLAEASSWLYAQKRFGERGLLRVLEQSHFDPRRTGIVAEKSVLDNGLDPWARQTIYNKGGYAAFLLHQELGGEAFAAGARKLIAERRFSGASDDDAERAFSEASGKDLKSFFSAWLRSAALLDLALETREGSVLARNLGTAPPPAAVDLWRVPAQGEPERLRAKIGEAVPFDKAERMVLDPELRTADMHRDNNILPRRPNPRGVARSARGELLVTYGEPYAWSPVDVVHTSAGGQRLHEWHFDRGLLAEPVWSADGTRILAAALDEQNRLEVVALNPADASRRGAGRVDFRPGDPAGATATAAETIVSERDRLVRFESGRATTLVRRAGHTLGHPSASPDGKLLAYSDRSGNGMELRLRDLSNGSERLLLAWHRSPVRWAWTSDSRAVYAALAGDWDWQLWELRVDGAARPVARRAAALGAVAVSPDDTRVAFLAADPLDFAGERHEVFVMNRDDSEVLRFGLDGHNAHGLAWIDAGSLAVVVSDPRTDAVPRKRELRRLDLAEASLAAFP